MTRWIVAAALLSMVCQAQAADGPRRAALLVGVNRYTAPVLADKPLRYAERDAVELGKVLTAQGFDDVKVLTGPAATRKAIDAALDELLKNPKADDLILIGFAGHGTQMGLRDEQGNAVVENGRALSEAYFCPVDAVLGRPQSMVSLTLLMTRLRREAGVQLMLVDACRDDPAEAANRGLRTLSGDELVGRLPRDSAVVFSCSAGQQARETEKAGGGHGVFFHHVIEGLQGKAADPDSGEVTWDDLVGYLRRNVNKKAREWDPAEATRVDAVPRTRGKLQNPHDLRNLVDVPSLARVDASGRRSAPALALGSAAPEAKAADTITSRSTGMTLRRIPTGSFRMGSDGSEEMAQDDEKPKHLVRITRPFHLGVHEVTVGQFRRFVEATGYRTEAESDGKGGYGHGEGGFKQDPKFTWRDPGFTQSDSCPVVNVTWNDAKAFCDWLTKQEGGGFRYRLPSEAEWEYACRAGATTIYPNGDDPEKIVRIGNVADASAKRRFPDSSTITADDGYVFTSPVGSFAANAFGLYDMVGNVWEWCEDGYEADYYAHSPPDDPTGPLQAPFRVYRGGCWDFTAVGARSANRSRDSSEYRLNDLGFRVARVPSR